MTSFPDPSPHVHDFDFLFGHWDVTHRRLAARGVGSSEWVVTHGTAYTEPRMGGISNIEQHDCPEGGWRGVALRTLDIAKGEWSIYWISDRDGRLAPPVVGKATQDRFCLEGTDMDGDRPSLARFDWTQRDTQTPRWTQSFSYDRGQNWEINWIMDFTRAAHV